MSADGLRFVFAVIGKPRIPFSRVRVCDVGSDTGTQNCSDGVLAVEAAVGGNDDRVKGLLTRINHG
jgi:hypothetical protein